MSELSLKTREALLHVGTSTLTGVLNRRGLRSMFMQDVWPIRHDIPRMVGIAFTRTRMGPARVALAGRFKVRRWRPVRRATCSSSIRVVIRVPLRPEICMSDG